ncbi:MAG: hypothetical protein JSV10_08720 [Candidatus Zixiibacteriota bacterium]|nr:MAG: hypothetical protein JSV10_08720 [candidate division Zixibacteria bacterium]
MFRKHLTGMEKGVILAENQFENIVNLKGCRINHKSLVAGFFVCGLGLSGLSAVRRRRPRTDPCPVRGVRLSVKSAGEFVAQGADYHQPVGKAAVSAAISERNRNESVLATWAQGFMFAGSSALLLQVANLFPDYWYFSFFALTPFLYRIIKATSVESLRLGLLFGLSFFSASATGWLEISPLVAAVRLLCGTGLFALFGWTIGCARQRWGFNPSLVAVLWVGLELGVAKLGYAGGLLGETGFSHPLLHGLAGLFGLVAASAIIVLLNSLLALALTKATKAARTGVKSDIEDTRTWDILFAFNLSAQKAYLVPEGRAPPVRQEYTLHGLTLAGCTCVRRSWN